MIIDKMPQNLRDALFLLYCWKFSNTNCFSNMLFDLLCKADLGNRRLIAKGFPDHVKAFEMWLECGDQWVRDNCHGRKP